MQYVVVVCCSVLQCVAGWCIVLQCVASTMSYPWPACGVLCKTLQPTGIHSFSRNAMRCSALRCGAECFSVLQSVSACCSVFQRVALCCSVLQCVAVCCNVLQCVAMCCIGY